MANKWHNRGLYLLLQTFFQNGAEPTNLYLAFSTAAHTPDPDDSTFASPIIEVATGNGYSAGGISLNRNTTDFISLTQDDTNNRATITMKNLSFTPSGGPFPNGVDGARWAHLLTDEGTPSSRQVIASLDLVVPIFVSDGQALTLSSATFRITAV